MIIGISGKMGSGKSTAIEALRSLGTPVYIHKFASPLYAIQNFTYSTIASVYTPPEGFVKDRVLLQWLGTDWGRNTISRTLWVDLWRERAELIRSKDSEVIIVSDDTRFDNEAEMVRSMGGIVIHIDRPNGAAHAEGGVGIENHASEAGIKPGLIDYSITNSGSKEEFQEAFKALIKQIQADEAVA